jgi:hypothetical protein
MPIKPENRGRYPANWKQIRERILARAEHRCEKCKVANGTRIARGQGEDAGTYMTDDANVYSAETGEHLGQCRMSSYDVARMTDIVLTIAHLDHTPENCEADNLRAWCQRCHLWYDAEHHAETARATRRARMAIGDLFDAPASLGGGV